MKKTIRFLTILLAVVMCMAIFSGCGFGNGDNDTEKEIEKGIEEIEREFEAMGQESAPRSKILEELNAGIAAGNITLGADGYYEYNGEKYLKATSHETITLTPGTGTGYTKAYFPSGSTISNSTEYFFILQPVAWTVLQENNGKALLLSDVILDKNSYQTNVTEFKDGYKVTGTNYMATDWSASQMRSWLNEAFIDKLFDSTEKGAIQTTTLKNDITSVRPKTREQMIRSWGYMYMDRTLEYIEGMMSANGHDKFYYDPANYAAEDTQDKLFLLSYKEAIDTIFSSGDIDSCMVSDYLAAKGIDYNRFYDDSQAIGMMSWALRSPQLGGGLATKYLDGSSTAHMGGNSISVDSGFGYNNPGIGVRPALWLDLSKSDVYEREGDTIYFGSYPQDVVSENHIKINAEDEWLDALNFYTDGTTVEVASRPDSTVTNVVIPSEYKGKPVTKIRNEGFKGNSIINTITIPSSVTKFGQDAFTNFFGSIIMKNATPLEIDANYNAFTKGYAYNATIRGIIVPDSAVSSYKSKWSGFSERIYSINYLVDNKHIIEGTTLVKYVGNGYRADVPSYITSFANTAFSKFNGAVFMSSATPPSQSNSFNDVKSIIVPASALSTYESSWKNYSSKIYSNKHIVNNYFYIVDGVLSFYFGNSTQVTIPNSVTSINNDAFRDCSSLSSITIPNSVTSIGNRAFYNCSSLTSITIPNGVTSIGEYAFSDCTNLTNIIIPSSVTSIASYTFSGCSSLADIKIPSSVISIGQYAFRGTGIWNNTPDNNVVYADKWAIGYKGVLSGSLVLRLDTVGVSSFSDCTSLTSVTIPDSVINLGSGAFAGCTSLTSVIIGNGVNSIRRGTFSNCTSITDITIGEGVTSIGAEAFYNCTSLINIIIPNSVTIIEYAAFLNCTSITDITIGEGVTSIGTEAFENCTSLTNVNFNAINCADLNTSVISESGNRAFSNAGINGTGILVTFGANVTRIPACLFYSYSSSYSIVAPKIINAIFATGSQCAVIGSAAFSGCSGLTSITIPDSVTSIDGGAFSGCSSLTSITIPDSVTSIGNSAFRNCSNLTSMTIGNGVTSIDDNVFYNCSSLTSITIPNSVISIGYAAFYSCSSLTRITIPNSVTTIERHAFDSCSSLVSIIIPDSVATIGGRAFQYCSSLTSIIIGNSVTRIEYNAFDSCSSLTSITIGNSVALVSYEAFLNCSSLTIYTEFKSVYWHSSWNSSSRPVVWGCALSADKTYVVSYTKSSISNPTATNGITAPYREGYTFGGWSTTSGGTTAAYTAANVNSAPNGTTLYAIWLSSN